jgi:hypothetical protein
MCSPIDTDSRISGRPVGGVVKSDLPAIGESSAFYNFFLSPNRFTSVRGKGFTSSTKCGGQSAPRVDDFGLKVSIMNKLTCRGRCKSLMSRETSIAAPVRCSACFGG